MLYESKFTASFFFFFQSMLGGTFVIFEGSLICNENEAALIAFEVPLLDMVRMDSLPLRLQCKSGAVDTPSITQIETWNYKGG